ncbi:hypothetical protein B0H17DRAFT_1092166 [Mycena rosella]|uniref:DUF6533 domain-containing protein n=1 Tax=Mycena rosella TaxID=1033263 RepID=A0AAD7G7G2_MYCRO|nr:hypothetical protein B0H17DRAFT_1092166 [Mycena rosella]
MSDSAAGELALTEAVLRDVLVIRYISGLLFDSFILLYDHLLSLADEVRLIWSAKFTSSKFLFLTMRYLVPGMMITETIQLAGLSNVSLSNEFCKAWFTLSVLVGWVTIAINNWFVLLRVWVLWDRNRTFIISTLLFFIAMHATTLVLTWIGIAHMINTLYFEPSIQLCGSSAFSDLGVVWIPELLFEFLMLMAMGWKVRMRPKTLKGLHEDGFEHFLVRLTLANTVVFLAARSTLMFCLLFFMWSFTTTTTCRMILGLRRSAEHARIIEAAASRDSCHAQFIELVRIQRQDS